MVTPSGRVIERGPAKKAETVRLNADELRAGVVQVRFDNYSRYVGLPTAVADTLTVGFYPEGGYLVSGVANRVGVKSTDATGRGTDVSGRVLDSDGNEVATFTTIHRGMGTLVFVPQSGQSYRAEVDGHTYPLPAVSDKAAVIRADVMGRDHVAVGTSGLVPDGATVVVHSRGRMLYAGEAPRPGMPLLLPKAGLAGGVTSMLLLDGVGNTLSERLFFVWPDSIDIVRPHVSISDGSDGFRRLHIDLPEGADVAVSVLDGALAEADSATTIASTLLLQSDLRGHIEDAGWYFRGDRDRRVESAMDALMLTQGWRRYDIPSVLTGMMTDPQLPLEQGSEISGTVRTLWRNKPIEGAQVNLLAPTLNLARVVTTDADGRFTVSDVEFPEDTRFVVQSLNKKGGYEQNFTIDTVAYPALRPLAMPVQAWRGEEAPADVTVGKDYTTRMHYADGHLEVRLSDVTVQGYRPQDFDDPFQILATKSIDILKLEKEENLTTYEEIFRKFPGLTIKSNKVEFRGEPVGFWINGMTRFEPNISLSFSKLNDDERFVRATKTQLKFSHIEPPKAEMMPTSDSYSVLDHLRDAYPVHDIKRVDFIPPGMAMVFQTHGPVINLLTKGPVDMITDRPCQLKLVSPLGFQRPVERYQPAYGQEKESDLRSTIFWFPTVRDILSVDIPEYTIPRVVIEGTHDCGLIAY